MEYKLYFIYKDKEIYSFSTSSKDMLPDESSLIKIKNVNYMVWSIKKVRDYDENRDVLTVELVTL